MIFFATLRRRFDISLDADAIFADFRAATFSTPAAIARVGNVSFFRFSFLAALRRR